MAEDFFVDRGRVQDSNLEPKPKKNFFWWLLSVLVFLAVLSFGVFNIIRSAPTTFPINAPFIIKAGTSVRDITKIAKEAGFVKSETLLYAVLRLKYENAPIQASKYIFEKPLDVFAFALELTKGGQVTELLTFTITEGENIKQIAKKAVALLPEFDNEEFLQLAKAHEGKLFPETYHIPAHFTALELFTLLTKTFEEKISDLAEKIAQSQLTLDEIIILASIVEREANDESSMKMVAGILKKRLEIEMPLQVDASMEYVLNKPLKELTAEDLKQESPYNTYLNLGLPPTPIGNPGKLSIEAVLSPTPSDYLFYITGTDGTFYYARNFTEHRNNIARHLR